MQEQLFTNLGQPRILSRKRKTSQDRRRSRLNLYARLVGDWPIKTDPKTGMRYDVTFGRAKVRRAYETRCPQCGESWWCAIKRRRETQGVCGDCRRRASYKAVGSRRPTAAGYVEVKIADNDWQLEHRVVMAGELGRPLSDDETVHHINLNRTDNRVSNLQLRRGQHGRGAAHKCLDCGSFNIAAVPLAE